jgi:hypothetical protein
MLILVVQVGSVQAPKLSIETLDFQGTGCYTSSRTSSQNSYSSQYQSQENQDVQYALCRRIELPSACRVLVFAKHRQCPGAHSVLRAVEDTSLLVLCERHACVGGSRGGSA